MKPETRELMLKIAKCDELDKAKNDNKHPCHTIVHYQDDLSAFQIPEPWNGDIESAKVLIVGLNASIDLKEKEYYPQMEWDDVKKEYCLCKDWNDDKIAEYFEKRLESEDYQKRKTGGVNYWNGARKVAFWLLSNSDEYKKSFENKKIEDFNDNSELEKYYCLTEIVHCKTKTTDKESGFKEACSLCAKNYLNEIMKRFTGKYFIVLGGNSEKTEKIFKEFVSDEFLKGKKTIYFWHPSYWRYKEKGEVEKEFRKKISELKKEK